MLTEACCPPVPLMRRLFRESLVVVDAKEDAGRDVNNERDGNEINTERMDLFVKT
jgi:hypothetical protein